MSGQYQTSMVIGASKRDQLLETVLEPGVRVWNNVDRRLHMGDGQTPGGVPLGGAESIRDIADPIVRSAQTEFDERVKVTQFADPDIGPAGVGSKAADTAAVNRCIAWCFENNARGFDFPWTPQGFELGKIIWPENQEGIDGDTARPTKFTIGGEGVIKFTESGYLFDTATPMTYFYDLVIGGGLRFISSAGAGSKMINGDKFIRLILCPGLQVNKFDWVIHGVAYLQSVRMMGVICRGGNGAFVKAPMAYDSVFQSNIMEFGNDGIVIDGPGDPAVHTTSIIDNVIEGMGGRGAVLGACLASQVIGNYMEGNVGGEVFLNAGTAPHKGLEVRLNSFQQHTDRLAAGAYSIVWGESTALAVRSGGNFCTGHLHDMTDVAAIIDMTGDIVSAGKNLFTPDTGRYAYFNDAQAVVGWFDRKMILDPFRQEVAFTGKHDSGGTGPVITFGTNSPSNDAAQFERTTWARGSVVFNVNAASGQPCGWQCLESGTPGTWSFLAAPF